VQKDKAEIAADGADDFGVERCSERVLRSDFRRRRARRRQRRGGGIDSFGEDTMAHVFAENDHPGGAAQGPTVQLFPNAGEQAGGGGGGGARGLTMEPPTAMSDKGRGCWRRRACFSAGATNAPTMPSNGRIGHGENDIARNKQRAGHGEENIAEIIQYAFFSSACVGNRKSRREECARDRTVRIERGRQGRRSVGS